MKKLIIASLISLPVVVNLVSIGVTNLNIHNNYVAPISYAVDSSPKEAIEQFTNVKNWMEDNQLTTGNTCIFIKTNPYCELSNLYNNRIVLSITESANVTNPTEISNLSLKLNERFMTKNSNGSEFVKQPINLNLYMRWRSLNWLGYWIDWFSWLFILLSWLLVWV